MFGSKKRKEAQEAARAEFAAESAETLAGFKDRAAEIEAMSDMGEKLLALNRLEEETRSRSYQERNKLSVDEYYEKAMGNGAFYASFLGGGALYVTGVAVSAALMAGLTVPIALVGYVTGHLIDKRAANKPKRQGLYDEDFVKSLDEINRKALVESYTIAKEEYAALSSSKVFDKVMEKYPSIKDAFVKNAVKKPAEEKPLPPPLRGHGQQDFTL